MVNMPINISAFPTDELGLVTDINQNINQEYYEWLLKQHNYFPEYAFHKERFEDTIKMEHSYTRDWKPTTGAGVMTTRTILMERPPLCPSCHQLPPNHDEKVDTPETYNIPIPPYNEDDVSYEEAGRKALNATADMIKSCPNRNANTDDWTQNIHKFNWTEQQQTLFERVERILDMDQLGRLAVATLPNECLRRNAIIEKSVSRMRAALASVHWESRLTSWLHILLMTHLPSDYMVSYIDILQTLKRKIPTLVDKMLYHKPIEMHKDYLSAIMKRPWQPSMVAKTRTLPSNPVIVMVMVSSTACSANTSSRERRWLNLLATLTCVESITVNQVQGDRQKTIVQVTEQLVALTRAKIQEIRSQTPNRNIVLAGLNAGAAIALQVALIEPVNSIVCLGFAFNVLNGVRGTQDDRILELTTPVLFVVGQNAQRSSQEEIELLREKMSAQTLLVVVGSSDDSLRIKRLNRSMEGISQSMIDNMIMDEIQEFATNCISNPPGPRSTKQLNGCRKAAKQRAKPMEDGEQNGPSTKRVRLNGSQKLKSDTHDKPIARDRIHTNRTQKPKNGFDEALMNMTFDDVVSDDAMRNGDDSEEKSNDSSIFQNRSPSIKQKVKYIPQNQFVHIKPPPINTQKIYVKQQDGNQSYTLGVKNIGENTVAHNKLLTVTNKVQCVTPNASPKKVDSTTNTAEIDTSLNDIDIFDIPILFADNDGNIIEENQPNNGIQRTIKPNDADDISSIDVVSEEIVNDAIEKAIAGNEPIAAQEVAENPTIQPKPASRGKFVVLNKHTLSQLKTVKHIPAVKFKKVFFPRGSNIRCISASGRLNSIDSKTPRTPSAMRTHAPKLPNFTRLYPYPSENKNNQQLQANGDAPKSGILIKRNHMKNLTVRQVNVIQSKKLCNTVGNRGNGVYQKNGSHDSNHNSKDDSITNLIRDLES